MKQAAYVYKKILSLICILSLMIVVPVYAVQEFIIQPYLPENTDISYDKMLMYMLSIWLISLFIYVFRIAVIKSSFTVLENDGGSKPRLSDIMDFSVRFWPKMILTSVIYAVTVAFGMFLIILGIIFFISYAYYQHAAVKTGLWGRKALLVSSLYMRKGIGQACAVAFGTVIIRYAVSYFVSFVQVIAGSSIAASCIAVVIYTLMELAVSLIDVYVCVYMNKTALDVDISGLLTKKSGTDA